MRMLPPGQRAIDHFPRFGLPLFAERFPQDPQQLQLTVERPGQPALPIDATRWGQLPRHEQVSDFHCVTTWSRLDVRWGGVRFADLHAACAGDVTDPASLVVLIAEDGYRSALPLGDLLQSDVLLADRLDGQTLPIAHGAPLRLVAPAHYGYKNLKHVQRIRFGVDPARWRQPGPAFLSHPRGRVTLEERGRGLPGWLLRLVWRPMIGPTARRFESALQRHLASGGQAPDRTRR